MDMHVYVMADDLTGHHKVGSSRVRMNAISALIERPLRLVYQTEPSPYGRKIERDALLALKRLCVKGEWFDCSEKEAVLAVRQAFCPRSTPQTSRRLHAGAPRSDVDRTPKQRSWRKAKIQILARGSKGEPR